MTHHQGLGSYLHRPNSLCCEIFFKLSRPFVAKIEATIQSEKEAKEAKLAMNLRQADFDSIEAKIQADLETLDNLVPKEDGQATEHAKDMKYLRERQQCLAFVSSCFPFLWPNTELFKNSLFFPVVRLVELRTGKAYVEEWMRKHCFLVDVSEGMGTAVQSFLKFKEQFRASPDQCLVLKGQVQWLLEIFHPGW